MNSRRINIILLIAISLGASAPAAKTPKSPPSKKELWAEKHNREKFAEIVKGNFDMAIEKMNKYLAKEPNDQESMFGMTAAYAQKQDIAKAMKWMKRSLAAGISFERFLAGPRDLLLPLTASDQFKEFAKDKNIELLHGPMLGCLAPTGAKFWVRTVREVPVSVLVSESKNMASAIESAQVKTNPDREYTAIIAIDGLKPNSIYYYQLVIDGKKQPAQWSFRTTTPKGTKTKFQIGFGGGASYNPKNERMWQTIFSHNPLAFLLLGDNVYIDHPTMQAVQQYCYYRRQSRDEFRAFSAVTAIFAIYDDHDFATNDSHGGSETFKPWWKLPVWKTFRNNWNNPSYGGGESQPGCWFDFSIGDVDFFMLDGRYYRTNPKKKTPSMLGPVQKAWLLEKLKASKATFKILASPVPWSKNTKPGSLDTWDGFEQEREDIFSFINKNKIDGVILISADRHRSDARKTDRENGYPLYEFESSKLTNIHTHRLEPGSIFGYNKKCSFGLLTFDTTAKDPQINYQIVNIDNEVIHELKLKKSQLSHK